MVRLGIAIYYHCYRLTRLQKLRNRAFLLTLKCQASHVNGVSIRQKLGFDEIVHSTP